MKKICYILVCLFIVVILIPKISAFQMFYFTPYESAKIYRIEQYSSIENKDLYSETLIEGSIKNRTLSYNNNFTINFYAVEGNRLFTFFDLNVTVCNESVGSWGGDYEHMSTSCNKSINFVKEIDKQTLKIIFNLNQVDNAFHIRINYRIHDFIIENGNYEVGWLRTVTEPGLDIDRTLMLPSPNSVMESWNNLKIIYRVDSGKWVLQTNEIGDAMIWYRDYEKENNERTQRDWLIIVITLGLSILIQLYFSQKMSQRTYNLWMFASLFLIIVAGTLFSGKASRHLSLLLISLFLFLFFAYFASLSKIKGEGRVSTKRELKTLIRFIKNDITNSFLFWLYILIVLIAFYLLFNRAI